MGVTTNEMATCQRHMAHSKRGNHRLGIVSQSGWQYVQQQWPMCRWIRMIPLWQLLHILNCQESMRCFRLCSLFLTCWSNMDCHDCFTEEQVSGWKSQKSWVLLQEKTDLAEISASVHTNMAEKLIKVDQETIRGQRMDLTKLWMSPHTLNICL